MFASEIRENESKSQQQLRQSLRTRGRNGERGKIHGADFVTRSNYFVTDARQIGDWASVVLAYHYEMLLAAAAVVSIRSSDSIDYSRLSTPKKEDEQSRCMPGTSIGSIAMPSSRPQLTARLTPLLQIDGYPTSTVPGCV